jgi:group I intron endonuclease
MAVIYQITNMENGKYYIGSAESFERRRWQHTYDLKKGTHKNPRLQAAWNKYGPDAFVFEVLETVPEGRTPFDVENTYLMRCVGQPDCYNINTDAYTPRLGIPHTEESKAKMARAMQVVLAEGRGGKFIPTVETRSKMSEALKGNTNALGVKRSEAEREGIRQRMLGNTMWTGKTHSGESREKMSRAVRAVLPDRSQQRFVGLSVMRDTLGVSLMTLIRACKSGRPIKQGVCAGWVLSYEDAQQNVAPEIPEEYAAYPRTRAAAKAAGATRYFTGLPCEHGHIALRKTKGTCVECAKIDGEKSNEKKRIAKHSAS